MNITATITAPAGYAVRLETMDGAVTVKAVRLAGERSGAWMGNAHVVKHIDGNPLNNALDNLRLVPRS